MWYVFVLCYDYETVPSFIHVFQTWNSFVAFYNNDDDDINNNTAKSVFSNLSVTTQN